MRVLLISPVAGRDVPTGDVTYTEALMRHPPAGVTYTTYDQALKDRRIVERCRRRSPRTSPGAIARLGREAVINRLRSGGVLFREPFSHFSIDEQAFDLVHSHGFSVNLGGSRLPLVASNAVPVDTLYRDAFRARPLAVRARRRADELIARQTGVMHVSFGQADADLVVCFSEHLRACFIRRGGDPRRYVVIPPAVDLPATAPLRPPPTATPVVGFVGDFSAKGGETVLAAHRLLRDAGVAVCLQIVGTLPRIPDHESKALDVCWLPRQPQQRLLEHIIPSFSIFAYPSQFDGLPLTLLEVMAAGVPCVVSTYGALPEVVAFGRAGRIVPPRNPSALANEIRAMLRPDVNASLSHAAAERVRQSYSWTSTAPALRDAYLLATRRRGSPAPPRVR